ncbi:MAG TPA: ABC-F family ATP-binding cassette domain-containing protein [Longimicrobiales bacterium]|nr:ABC-F family ATP-binding cassette domain-containing protein [Longimicrobiales bacterium]
MTQIALSGVAVEFGATTLLRDVSFTVGKGERWGIVGRNGTGKTTLLQVITGALPPTRGVATRAPGLRFTLLDQHREFPGSATVWEAAASPFAALQALEASLHEQAARLGEMGESASPEALERYDRDLERFGREGGYTFAARVDAVLHGLGFDPAAARAQPIAQLSGGELGRIGLARQLVAPADVLLLDEPTNHLDLETTRWLEEYLRGLDATVLLISHDRAFLAAVVDHVLHLEAGTAVPYAGGYADFVRQRAERRLAQERAYDNQRRVIAAEEDYIRRNIAGQNSRQAKGRRTRLARLPRLSPPPTEDGASMALRLEPAARGGDQVLVAENARVAVGSRMLIEGFSARIERGEVIGLVGPNGAGKSTLLKAIAGLRPVDGGEVRVGSSVDVAYYRQDLAQVPLDVSLFKVINDLRPLWDRGKVQGHLGRFGFSGDEARRRADTLSGGERARVALAMLMLARANFLLLDEPTNHLDVESIEALEDALEGFDGTVLLVSHDRALLRAVVTRVWSLEDGRITDYPGTFAEWEEERAAREEEAARAASAARQEARERERRDRERQQARERARGSTRGAPRALRQAVLDAEAEVSGLEARIVDLRGQLEDPALYTSGDGARRAGALKEELAAVEASLNAALERWAEAGEAFEAAGG